MKIDEHKELWANTRDSAKFVNYSIEEVISDLESFKKRVLKRYAHLLSLSYKIRVLEAFRRKRKKRPSQIDFGTISKKQYVKK